MDPLLARLRRERRWAVFFLLAAAALIALVQGTLAPSSEGSRPLQPSRTSAGEAQP